MSISHNSANSHIILPPRVFLNELLKIKQDLVNENLELPVSVTRENLATLYRLSIPETIILNGQLIISITIPLINRESFTLIKPTSFPLIMKKSIFGFVTPSHDFIALDPLFEKYVYLSNDELNTCHHIDNNHLICKSANPIMNAGSVDICEIEMLRKSNDTHMCDIRAVNLTKELWIKLHKPNTWIYVFPKPVHLFINCNNSISTSVVEGTGMISIQPFCRIKTDSVIISGHRIRESVLQLNSTHRIDTTNLLNSLYEIINTSELAIPAITAPKVIEIDRREELNELSVSLKELERMQESYDEQISKQTAFQELKTQGICSLSATMLIITIFVLVRKYGIPLIRKSKLTHSTGPNIQNTFFEHTGTDGKTHTETGV